MYLKQLRKLFQLLILSGLLIFGGQILAQTPEGSSSPPADLENHDTKDLEELLKRYNTDAKKVLEDTSKIHEADATTSEVEDLELESMAPSEEQKALIANAMKNAKEDMARKKKVDNIPSSELSANVRLILEPMQKLSEKELLKMLDENTKESAMRPYMDQFPKVTIFAVRLIKDKDSIPFMAKILENKQRLIHFGGFMLSTIILGFVLKRVMHREGRSFIKAALYFFVRLYFMLAVRIYIIYYFFSNELAPAARVFKNTFM